ncbi:MAG TPA: ATP-dependent zinc metalloprotease FtsH [Polyangiaceae bacterium LLY-WYZ-15_(1-7)]|nr:ATP-dependent zinc metalloprotease FtsH [Polyangiaceae bacterium LLY-WYZ-15_(1-7)]HJL03760.1 ATP-dependent zinc metalloprotease FtsH [Polyangiaceae bacterium LLY-WYZ-15_(1-7)]HJL08150.1 ATP-dependent zinc metalloprotease FtsH [Polyangiaceae bacterium LLY-WYZ-15_(1-7)]HJL21188.1 ATP-dependent zinc metalloprotease FtsH [Polyangiaceae bacterium LLY-WYZ-15_(1-7)]HJL31827.1 ATP-dependent zinc metalloprotease FtsH [Polyangiaceae bacterium LLY-WYZ-15_(1-7)]
MKRIPWWWWLAPVLLVGSMMALRMQDVGKELRWDELVTAVEEDRVKSVVLESDLVRGMLKGGGDSASGDSASGDSGSGERFRAVRVDDESFVPLLREHGVEIRAIPESDGSWTMWIWLALPLILLFWLSSRMASGGAASGALSFGRSKGKIFTERDIRVTFEDVAGVDEAKAELREVIDFLQQPEKYRRIGARIPKGVLLVGPPGTGKTLLARAVAGEAGVPFISISGSEFVEMFVGVGAARVRDLFEQAAKTAPAIVFIDELDALGRARGPGNMPGSNEEREQTLNQLLVELDGFEPLGEGRGPVVLLAATNRPEVLDPALLRAGRFDRQIIVDTPDRKGRRFILEVHVRKVPLDDDVDLDVVATRTPGFAGADLANLVNEAALRAAREGRDTVQMEDFSAAVDRVLAGLEQRSRLVDEEERERVAYHETGHAICATFGGSGTRVHKVSIVPRSVGALGFTMQLPERERKLYTVSQLKSQIVGLLGGRAAEELIYGEPSTGAADDLRKATDIARAMVLEHGFSEAVGPVAIEQRSHPYLGTVAGSRDVGEAVSDRADAEVRALVEGALEEAKRLLEAHREELEGMTRALLEREQLEGEELLPWLPAKNVQEEPARATEPPEMDEAGQGAGAEDGAGGAERAAPGAERAAKGRGPDGGDADTGDADADDEDADTDEAAE